MVLGRKMDNCWAYLYGGICMGGRRATREVYPDKCIDMACLNVGPLTLAASFGCYWTGLEG